jgi:hypothetical protein
VAAIALAVMTCVSGTAGAYTVVQNFSGSTRNMPQPVNKAGPGLTSVTLNLSLNLSYPFLLQAFTAPTTITFDYTYSGGGNVGRLIFAVFSPIHEVRSFQFDTVGGSEVNIGGTGTASTTLTGDDVLPFIGTGQLTPFASGSLNYTISTEGNGSAFFLTGPYTYQSFYGQLIYDYANLGVPEPATWAMMIAGFGLIGVALRRHRPTIAQLFQQSQPAA